MFTKILCATDGSPDAGRALDAARSLAADSGAAIDVVHVIEYLPAGRAAGLSSNADEDEVRTRIAAQIKAAGVTCVPHLPHAPTGKAAQSIADLADELGSEVIVVGTRGHSALAGVLLGSVTQQLLHVAPCPVLAVPPARATAQTAATGETAAGTE